MRHSVSGLPRITFAVSGTAMDVLRVGELYASLTYPGVVMETSRRAGEALRAARPHRGGQGWSHQVVCDVQAASVIWAYCDYAGHDLMRESSLGPRSDGRGLLQVRDRISLALDAAGLPAPEVAPPPRPVLHGRPVGEEGLLAQGQARKRARLLNTGDDVPRGMVWVAHEAPGARRGWAVTLRPLD